MTVNYQDVLAKAYVAMAEIDYDLRTWGTELAVSKGMALLPPPRVPRSHKRSVVR